MTKDQRQVHEFHKRFNCTTSASPQLKSYRVLNLRASLMMEELSEFMAAARNFDLVGMADALGDLVYVVHGTALSLGIDLEPVVEEIHRSNMTKSRQKDEGGKIQKGPGYTPPDIAGVLKRQGWQT